MPYFLANLKDAVGISKPIFKLLGETEILKNNGKVLMTNRYIFQVDNIGNGCYYLLATCFQTSLKKLATLYKPTVK